MKKRKETYKKAKAKHPERWSKGTRNWTLPEYVSLNPISVEEAESIIDSMSK
jgi:putative transposase